MSAGYNDSTQQVFVPFCTSPRQPNRPEQGQRYKSADSAVHKTVRCSHLFGFLVFLIIIVILILIIFLVIFFFLLRLLRIIFLLLFGCLNLTQCFPLRRKAVGLSFVIGNDDIVKDRAALHLPQVEADETEVIVLVDSVVILVLRIRDLLRLPETLVGRVRDPLAVPVTLVGGVVFHGPLPLSVLLIVPVVGLLGLAVHHPLLLHPVVGLLVLGVVDHGVVHPIVGLLVVGVRDLLWLQHLPVLLDGALVDLLLVDLDAYRVVRLQDHGVEMG